MSQSDLGGLFLLGGGEVLRQYYARVSTEEINQLKAFSRQKEELKDYIESQKEW